VKSYEPKTADQVISELGMKRLPVESTFYKSTYVGEVDPKTNKANATAILALYSQTPLSHSLFHKLKHDEMWHFYKGDPIQLHLIYPNGEYKKIVLGDNLTNHQFVVPKGVWQAGELLPGGTWGLFGCTMAPGFVGSEFIGGKKSELLALCPSQSAVIERLAIADDHQGFMPNDFKQ
jgi:predicted cupin superfamily sugar epimerase